MFHVLKKSFGKKKSVVPLEPPTNANGCAVDFDYFSRCKRTRADAKMRRAAGDALGEKKPSCRPYTCSFMIALSVLQSPDRLLLTP
jgi:hypothetical protein